MDIDSTQHQIYTEREGIHSGSILYTAPDIHREGRNTLRFYTLHSTRYTQGGREYTPDHRLYTARDIHREGGNTLRFYTLHSTRDTQGGREYTPVLYSTQHQRYTGREGIHSGSILYTAPDIHTEGGNTLWFYTLHGLGLIGMGIDYFSITRF